MAQLKQMKHYAMTTDLWTSGACDPYITLTIHYIDGEWSLKSKCLDTVALFADHTGDNIADCVTDILSNWELEIKNVVAATTDSGSKVISAFRTLDLLRISCFGHNLDLAVKKGLNSSMIQRALSRCHTIVNVFHRSWKKTRDLKEKQQLLGIPQLKLKNEVSTRWGSVYEMIERIIEQQQAISAVLAEDRKYWYAMPTDEELNVLERVLEVLKNVYYLTDALSGEKEVTVSALQCIFVHVKSKLSPCSEDNHVASSMKQAMMIDLNSRYSSPRISEILDICSFLDPRFKTKYLENKEGTISLITEECLSTFDNGLEQDEQQQHNVHTSTSTVAVHDHDVTGPVSKKLKGLTAILKNIEKEDEDKQCTPLTHEQQIDNKIPSYLDFPIAEIETSPLVWWKVEYRRFPTLSQLAKKYLCIPATSVPSERVFSSGGHIVSSLRARLHPKNVNKLIFLSQNL